MTDALAPFDSSSMPITNLRPLDFSSLPNFNDTFACSPQANWGSIFSPPCAKSSPTLIDSNIIESTLSTNPFPSGSPYFGSFSSLFGTPKGSRNWNTALPIGDVFTTESKPCETDIYEPPAPLVEEQHPIEQPQQPYQTFHQKTQFEPMTKFTQQPDLLRASSEVTGASFSSSQSLATTSVESKPAPKIQKKSSKRSTSTMSSIEKAAERRRKNRESSSRCYYNRKRIIENLDKQISEEKSKLTLLYDRALELRHENAKLKRDVVTAGIPLPTKPRRSSNSMDNSTLQLKGYLQLLQSAQFFSNK